MRGAVTLAAALSIPLALPDGTPMPGRDLVIAIAFGVTLATLLLHGTTLAWLIRKLGVSAGDDVEKEDRLARLAAVEAGLLALKEFEGQALDYSQRTALQTVKTEYLQRQAVLASDGEDQAAAIERTDACLIYRRSAIIAEREAIDELWLGHRIADGVHRPLQTLLDHEEKLLREEAAQP